MVTVKFKSFLDYKDYVNKLGSHNPNRTVPFRFYSVNSNNTVNKIAQVLADGSVVLLYDAATNEVISPDDAWFKENPELNYPASILVSDVGESIQ